jgi:hypothetical protein
LEAGVLDVTRDIEQAASSYHVVLLVRECLVSISPRELERIPPVGPTRETVSAKCADIA